MTKLKYLLLVLILLIASAPMAPAFNIAVIKPFVTAHSDEIILNPDQFKDESIWNLVRVDRFIETDMLILRSVKAGPVDTVILELDKDDQTIQDYTYRDNKGRAYHIKHHAGKFQNTRTLDARESCCSCHLLTLKL